MLRTAIESACGAAGFMRACGACTSRPMKRRKAATAVDEVSSSPIEYPTLLVAMMPDRMPVVPPAIMDADAPDAIIEARAPVSSTTETMPAAPSLAIDNDSNPSLRSRYPFRCRDAQSATVSDAS